MTRARLVPCPSCARHVRATDASCPFCQGEIAEPLRAAGRAPARRALGLGRAAVFGVALSTAAGVGCGDSEPAADDTMQQEPEPTTGGDTQPATDPGAGTTPDDGTVDDDGSVVAEYGAPAPD